MPRVGSRSESGPRGDMHIQCIRMETVYSVAHLLYLRTRLPRARRGWKRWPRVWWGRRRLLWRWARALAAHLLAASASAATAVCFHTHCRQGQLQWGLGWRAGTGCVTCAHRCWIDCKLCWQLLQVDGACVWLPCSVLTALRRMNPCTVRTAWKRLPCRPNLLKAWA